jgi:ribosome biogenesis GTPase
MASNRKRGHREKDLTRRFLTGEVDDDRLETCERFSGKRDSAERRRIERTALLRAAEEEAGRDLDSLPIGQVVQVYSLYCDVEHESGPRLCVVRKTLARLSDSPIVVGDLVRFRDIGTVDESGRPEAVIEQVLPRRTILTRADSFKAVEQQPIVANAAQMLIVVSLHQPDVKWGLVDRMLVAAQAGGLTPIVCLNKIDLAAAGAQGEEDLEFARSALAHYASLGIRTLMTSVPQGTGLAELKQVLQDQCTVLAGHSGVGKSSLINAIEPTLNLRVGEISGYTGKGRHTTTTARRYALSCGGHVIDTPGVKLFGLWNVTADNLIEYFPDVANETAPQWRVESYRRILASLA